MVLKTMFFQRIERLLGVIIPFEWDVQAKEAYEPLRASGIIWDEASQKIGLPLQALHFPEGCRNFLNNEDLSTDIILVTH